MIPAVRDVIAEFEQASNALLANLAKVPDERLNRSPAPTARTPLEIVAHCAESIQHLTAMMEGAPFEVPTTAEAGHQFRLNERAITSRQQALDAYRAATDRFLGVLNALQEEDLDRMAKLPFNLGEAPMRVMITLPAMHTRSHIPQLEYVQTCYGDRSWL